MCRWKSWEEKILEDWGGRRSSRSIIDSINRRRTAEGLTPRTYDSVIQKSRRMGIDLTMDFSDNQTLGGWAKELSIDVEALRYAYHRTLPNKRRRRPGDNTPRYITKSSIDQVLENNPALARQCEPQVLEYLRLNRAIARLQKLKGKPAPTRNTRIVKRVDTEEEFSSIAEAEAATHVARCTIHRGLRSGKPVAGGMVWEYVSD
jgi:hypothetical protein